MLIVDAQIHLWSQGIPTNALHRQIPSYSAEECLMEMDNGGVQAALIHPPGWDPNSLVVAESAAVHYPDRFAILGQFPLDQPESRELIAGWKTRPGMLGLRFALLQPHQLNLPTDAKVAERHPGLKLIIDHFGRARGGKDDAAFANVAEVAALAKFPNVALKATGAAGESSEPYPFRNIHKYIQQLYDAFGPQRFFWGTDITRMPCSWLKCVTMFTEELPWLKGQD